MKKLTLLGFFLAICAWGCEPAGGESESAGGQTTSPDNSPAAGEDQCTVCTDADPYFEPCTNSEVLEDARVCIDTDEDEDCETPATCCAKANLTYDNNAGTCIDDQSGMSGNETGQGQPCTSNDDCSMDFPRCEKSANQMGTCEVECLSNDDCFGGSNGNFCNANNRCAMTRDGTCQIETPADPRTADPECDGDSPTCMPLEEGASLGICVECYEAVSCFDASMTPVCSTRGVCIGRGASDECARDEDCCPTPNASCAERRRCNAEKQCESIVQ